MSKSRPKPWKQGDDITADRLNQMQRGTLRGAPGGNTHSFDDTDATRRNLIPRIKFVRLADSIAVPLNDSAATRDRSGTVVAYNASTETFDDLNETVDVVTSVYDLVYSPGQVIPCVSHNGKLVPLSGATVRHAVTVKDSVNFGPPQYPRVGDVPTVYAIKFTGVTYDEIAGRRTPTISLLDTSGSTDPDDFVFNLAMASGAYGEDEAGYIPEGTHIWVYHVDGQWYTFVCCPLEESSSSVSMSESSWSSSSSNSSSSQSQSEQSESSSSESSLSGDSSSSSSLSSSDSSSSRSASSQSSQSRSQSSASSKSSSSGHSSSSSLSSSSSSGHSSSSSSSGQPTPFSTCRATGTTVTNMNATIARPPLTILIKTPGSSCYSISGGKLRIHEYGEYTVSFIMAGTITASGSAGFINFIAGLIWPEKSSGQFLQQLVYCSTGGSPVLCTGTFQIFINSTNTPILPAELELTAQATFGGGTIGSATANEYFLSAAKINDGDPRNSQPDAT